MLVTLENRSRTPLSVGLFHIIVPILLSVWVATVAEKLCAVLPTFEIVLKAGAVLFIGTRWRALGNIIHECCHGIFVENRKHNETIGHLLCGLEFTDFKVYCQQHQTHHAHLGDPEHDLDFKARLTYLADTTPNLRRIVVSVLTAITLVPLWLKQQRPVVWSEKNPLWTNALRLLLLAGSVTALTHTQTSYYFLLYVFLPYATSYQWMRLFSDCADHIFLYGCKNEIDRSRNHIFHSTWLNALLFPRNDAYHLVHHLFPSLPTQHYPDVHNKFLRHPWYAMKEHVFRLPWDNYGQAELESQGQSR